MSGKAISDSISVQPYVESIEVSIDRDGKLQTGTVSSYCELEGRMLNVTLYAKYKDTMKSILKYDKHLDYL